MFNGGCHVCMLCQLVVVKYSVYPWQSNFSVVTSPGLDVDLGSGTWWQLHKIKVSTLNQRVLVGCDYNYSDCDWTHLREWQGTRSPWEQYTHHTTPHWREADCLPGWMEPGCSAVYQWCECWLLTQYWCVVLLKPDSTRHQWTREQKMMWCNQLFNLL